jgi:Protein of unknown function (DUF3108)
MAKILAQALQGAPIQPPIPSKALWSLAAAVAVAHGVVLQWAGNTIHAAERQVTRPFVTRTIALSTASTEAASVAASPRATSPKPVARAARPAPDPQARSQGENTSPNSASALAENAQAAPEKAAPQTSDEVSATAAPQLSASAPQTPAVLAQAAPEPPVPADKAATARAPTAAVAYTVPGSIRLKYNVLGTKDNLNYSARAEMLWLQDGSTYEARLEVSAFLIGTRTRTSTGRLGTEGLLPTRFSDKYRSEVAAHFERDKGKVSFSANTPDVPLQEGMQDQLSVFVQIGAMLGGERAKYPAGAVLTFETIGPRSPETWVITVNGEETLQLPGGEMQAVKLTRAPRRDYDQTAELWLAPRFGYLPARIKITERNGDFVDQQWRTTEAP